jgi:hypothetical protein
MQLAMNDDTQWEGRDFLPWISGIHASRDDIDAFVARCRDAGVTLGPRAMR